MPLFNPPSTSTVPRDADGFLLFTGMPPVKFVIETDPNTGAVRSAVVYKDPIDGHERVPAQVTEPA